VRRREFIATLGAALTWPLAAHAQQGERVKQIGMLSEFSEAQMQPLVDAFREQLNRLG
jgi:putative ABC transport system substrate-binding protein